MVKALRKGDKVLTAGGIIGSVDKVISDTEVSVEIADGVKVRVLRNTITDLVAKTQPVAEKAMPVIEAEKEKQPESVNTAKKSAPKAKDPAKAVATKKPTPKKK
jgi:preprotein translocase subunit YajC